MKINDVFRHAAGLLKLHPFDAEKLEEYREYRKGIEDLCCHLLINDFVDRGIIVQEPVVRSIVIENLRNY